MTVDIDFRPTKKSLPEPGQLVDWISPFGVQVNGGKFGRVLWLLPPDHEVYTYYEPVAWRPAVGID